jgi:hypothetical protein
MQIGTLQKHRSVSRARHFEECAPFVSLGALHFKTVAKMLNLGKSFRAFASLASSHTLIAVESDTNTKCEKSDWPIQIERLYDAVNASWLQSRLRLTPQHTFDLPQTFENSGLQRAIFTYSLATNSNSSS